MPGKPVFGPISNEEFSSEDSKKELEAVNLIKICVKIKKRTCANGSRHKRYLK